eukprot:3933026-Rhodomonas_salina.3
MWAVPLSEALWCRDVHGSCWQKVRAVTSSTGTMTSGCSSHGSDWPTRTAQSTPDHLSQLEGSQAVNQNTHRNKWLGPFAFRRKA